MARLVQLMRGSTIGVRLVMVSVVPLAGLVLFGVLSALQEREAQTAALHLRQEAEQVELLAGVTVALDLTGDFVDGLEQAEAFGIDVERLTVLLGGELDGGLAAEWESLANWFDEAASYDRASWADPEAVDLLLATWDEASQLEDGSEPSFEGLAEVRPALSEAASQALSAQTERLHLFRDPVELDPELSAISRSLEPMLELSVAAAEGRRALADYLLPISEGSREDGYRRLIGAAAQYELLLSHLGSHLPPSHQDHLQEMQQDPSWVSYTSLRDQVLAGEVEPITDFVEPAELIPTGITTFLHGYIRSRLVRDLSVGLTEDFVAGTHDLEQGANERLARDLLLTGLVVVAALSISYITVRSITWPLRALLGRARDITHGDLKTVRPSLGPADFETVHDALDEMSANLRILAGQAKALSAGRLEDEVLNRTVVGPLGASVHGSVARLRSMTSRLEYEASHDALTGLPNRAALLTLLDQCLTGAEGARTPLAAVMLDLDGFKLANDNMGHAVGDDVLIRVAERIRHRVADRFAARLGGDEFMIVTTGPEAVEEAQELAKQVVGAIAEPIEVSRTTIQISACAGIVGAAGPDWLSPSEVLRRTDLALYEAKADTPGQVVLFDQRLHDSLLETAQLQGELRRALTGQEFELHLQPIVRVQDRSITGYEALIRWHSERRGSVAPGLFIPVAEQSELITHIDTWVIDEAAKLLGDWSQQAALEHLSLSMNISARHLSHPDLATKIEHALYRYGAPASRLVVEMTESQLIPNLVRAEDTLRDLRSMGVRLAIDDFGTGYASVAHLRRISFDRLKIDQSFLANLHDDTERSLAALLVSLGRDLELDVVAEGIETESQLAWAIDAGCTQAQGYLFGHPAAPEVQVGSMGRSVPLN